MNWNRSYFELPGCSGDMRKVKMLRCRKSWGRESRILSFDSQVLKRNSAKRANPATLGPYPVSYMRDRAFEGYGSPSDQSIPMLLSSMLIRRDFPHSIRNSSHH
jgi:hypothetical protein